MEYKKKLKLKRLVITKNDLKKLIAVIIENKINKEDQIEITIIFKDETQISDKNVDIFEADYIDEREIQEIRIEYLDKKTFENSIEINLESNEFYSSYIILKSNQKEWFLIVDKILEEKIKSFKKQCIISSLTHHPFIITLISSVSTFLFISIMQLLKIINSNNWSPLEYGCIYTIITVLNYIAFYKISYLFPNVEFDIPINNIPIRKKMKKVLFWFFSAIIVQIFISIFVELILK